MDLPEVGFYRPLVRGERVFMHGAWLTVDAVMMARQSGDVHELLSAVELSAPHPIERHFLLLETVRETYRHRAEPGMMMACERVAWLHISEFPTLSRPLVESIGFMPRVPTFETLAIILEKKREFDGAIDICRLALRYGIKSRAYAGFTGRIAHLEKRRAQS